MKTQKEAEEPSLQRLTCGHTVTVPGALVAHSQHVVCVTVIACPCGWNFLTFWKRTMDVALLSAEDCAGFYKWTIGTEIKHQDQHGYFHWKEVG